MPNKKINSLILAGKRPADPLAQCFQVENKALISLNGKPLIDWVVEALLQSNRIKKLWISSTTEQEELFSEKINCFLAATDDLQIKILLTDTHESPVKAVFKALKQLEADDSLLITTADNPLLSKEIIEYFLNECDQSEAELMIGVVNGFDGLIQKFPEVKRTWHKLNSKVWLSGANLFYWSPRKPTSQAYQTLEKLESQRKSPLFFASTVGKMDWLFFAKFILQQTNLKECSQAFSKAIGIKSELIILPFIDACIDVDKPADFELVKKIIRDKTVLSEK